MAKKSIGTAEHQNIPKFEMVEQIKMENVYENSQSKIMKPEKN
jgi:hypothetical protein